MVRRKDYRITSTEKFKVVDLKRDINRDITIRRAIELIEAQGMPAITARTLAESLHISPSALYKQFKNFDELKETIVALVVRDLTELCSGATAGRSGQEAIEAFAHAQRIYAQAHPELFLASISPLQEPTGVRKRSGPESFGIELDILREYQIDKQFALELSEIFRALIQGFINLEIRGAFKTAYGADEHYQQLIDLITAGVPSLRTPRK